MPRISGETRLAGVIGDPARHSLSPAIHNAAFAATGLDWVYLAFEVPRGRADAALAAVTALDFGGLSVTMPHKTAVARAVDTRSGTAERLDAVNCVVPGSAGLHGENTDGDGFLAALRADAGLTVDGRSVLVIGGGGAARAVVESVARDGAASIAVHNRSPERATQAANLAGPRGQVVSLENLDRYDIIVNATPIGMAVADEPPTSLPCPIDGLGTHQVLVDLVYEPAETAWIRQARQQGIEAHNGLSMLVHQAAVAFGLWTGVTPPVDEMALAATAALAAR